MPSPFTYPIARGTTWGITITVMKNGALVNLTGHRLLATVRSMLVDGIVDGASPPVWQGDSNTTGINILPQVGQPTLGQANIAMPASVTEGLPNPVNGIPLKLYYDVKDNDGNGPLGTWQTEWGYIIMGPSVTLSLP